MEVNPLFSPSLLILVVELKSLSRNDICSIDTHFLDALEFIRAND
jgi:hypothetical protein